MDSTRRSFLRQSYLALAFSPFTIRKDLLNEVHYVHHVLFWLKDKENKENYTKMLKSLKAFGSITEVRFLQVGIPNVSDIGYEAQSTDVTYTFSYLALFNSKMDKENYLKHPLHTQFLNDFKDIVSKVIIYDSQNIMS